MRAHASCRFRRNACLPPDLVEREQVVRAERWGGRLATHWVASGGCCVGGRGRAAAASALVELMVEDCAVRCLALQVVKSSRVYTEKGRIGCEQVVVAGGAWSSLLLRTVGVKIPQLSVLASVGQTEPMGEAFAGNAADDRFAFRRRADGGYTVAPGARPRPASAPPGDTRCRGASVGQRPGPAPGSRGSAAGPNHEK